MSRASYSEHLGAWAAVALPAALVLAGIEAAGANAIASSTPASPLLTFVYLLAPYGLVAVVTSLFVAAISRLVAPRLPTIGADRVTIGAGTGAAALGGIYLLGVWARAAFNNAQLSSLLVAVISLVLVAFLAVIAVGARSLLSQREGVVRQVGRGLFVALGVTVLGYVLYDNRSGFEQLSPWLISMPIALLSWLAIAGFARRHLAAHPRVNVVALVVISTIGVGTFGALEAKRSEVPRHVAQFAPLSSWLAPTFQKFSDFDDDGTGYFFGGDDCAPFDEEIAPGLFDVPGDGIDNNCVGGDASKTGVATKPEWHDMPADWSDFNVLFITVETLRADHVGFMGYKRDTTPNLDELAQNSTVFENFYATSTFTRLALPSLLTSRTPSAIDFRKQKPSKFPRIAASNPWLPESLQDAGFTTGAVSANFPAFTDKDHIGFERGFDYYDPDSKLKYRGGTMRGFPSKAQLKLTNKWLRQHKKKRFFFWLHLFEPHFMYQQFPGAPKFGKRRIDLYDSEIWGCDQAIGKVIDELKKNGQLDNTIIVVTGDHGEEFEEHGKRYHGSNLYEPQVRTPLLIHVPGLEGRRVETPASFTDVAPTVLNLSGVREGFDGYSGRNLTPAFFGKPLPEAAIFMEVWKVLNFRNYKVAVLNWPYKLIANNRAGEDQELYDVADDPDEQENLLKKKPDVAKSMQELLHGYLDSTTLEYR